MKVICPICENDKHMSFDNQFSYEDVGYIGDGTVYFYECLTCGTQIEISIPIEVGNNE